MLYRSLVQGGSTPTTVTKNKSAKENSSLIVPFSGDVLISSALTIVAQQMNSLFGMPEYS